jgi:t-SNARE complex subunit (syntaxin)
MPSKDEKPEIVEVPIVKNVAGMNLNEATSANNQNPAFASNLGKNSPRWAKILFVIILAIIVVVFGIAFIVSLIKVA